jgi:integrase
MPAMRLTKTSIRDLVPSGRVELWWDEDLPGFGVRVSSGGTKAYIVQWREGRETKRQTLGSIEVLALDRARNAARDMLAAARLGEKVPNRSQEAAPKFGDVIDQFLRYAEAKKAPRTAADYRDRIERHIRPAFGAKRIDRITRAEIERWHEDRAATPRAANYALAILVAIFSYAVRVKIIKDADHPARSIPKYAETKRTRYLDLEELSHFGKALAGLETQKKVSPWAAAALRLLVLTGARSGEILTLKWEHVDLKARALRLPTSKTGAKTITLSNAAAQVLEAVPRIEGVPWVIAGRRHGERMTSLQKPFGSVCEAAGITGLRIHDLRHSAASIATSAGVGLPVVGALLGQSQAYTTQRYSHVHDSAERQAAEAIAERAAPLLNVVPLARTSR